MVWNSRASVYSEIVGVVTHLRGTISPHEKSGDIIYLDSKAHVEFLEGGAQPNLSFSVDYSGAAENFG